ncbi:MAG: NAD-dependent epimerase/dehydratase [Rhodobacteraceae bacterium CG17_big_fil_post_rev_8_21_14_2_50_63_15]|nr:NAD-dependent epimerase/dehydratase family protein [Roseovarius sp.]PIV78609.1 MAG: NAD-dependent epimerase/dehydratase [Rhodobacteraceae bacterium CG17_big_fil_post_rev_8_21_14_2_50_63_15]
MRSAHPADRCLFTGSNGRLGRLLQRAWPGLPGAPQSLWLARRAPAGILWSPGRPLPCLPACDTLVALWGRTAGDQSQLAVNSALLVDTMALARLCGAQRIFHFSSAAVYGAGTALDERDLPSPLTAYGAAKLAMEEAIHALPSDGIHHTILRLANVVGADSLAAALLPQNPPVLLDRFADGKGPLRSYIAPGDLAQVLAALAVMPLDTLPRCLNVAAPQPVQMQDLAQAADRAVAWRSASSNAVQRITLDSGLIEALLPRMAWQATASEMIADWRRLTATLADG